MTLPLYAVEKSTPGRIYCGPFCVMAITGAEYPTVRAIINNERGRASNKAIFGSNYRELGVAFARLGWRMWNTWEWGRNEGPTLAQWLRQTPRENGTYYLVNLTSHWCLVAGRRFIDTYTKSPVALSQAPHRRARIKKVFTVTKL